MIRFLSEKSQMLIFKDRKLKMKAGDPNVSQEGICNNHRSFKRF